MKKTLLPLFCLLFLQTYLYSAELAKDGATGWKIVLPDEPTIELWRQSIAANIAAGRFRPRLDTLVLDGIPRNVPQAEMLKDTLHVVGIFFLRSTNSQSLVQRIQKRAIRENRLDDASLKVIRRRLEAYEEETKPVLRFYGKNLVHNINSDQSPAKVLVDILRHVVKV